MSYEYNENDADKLTSRKITICNNILSACKKQNFCLGELSLLSGLSEEYVYKISTHSVLPSKKALAAIAVALHVPIETLNA
jgi:hypothetical protein